jgi:membrane protease YdiL (CAAX protease family)
MENKKINILIWFFPIVVIIAQLLPLKYLLAIGALISFVGLFKYFRILLLFGFTLFGHSLWFISSNLFSQIILNQQYLKIIGRFGFIGYIILFSFWRYFQVSDHDYFRIGNIKENIKFPLVWWGFNEYVWRFIVIFCILCSIVIGIIYFNVNKPQYIIYGLLFSFLNSFLEEILWRGFILTRLMDWIDEKKALIITSFAFGFYHLSLGFSIWACLAFTIGGFYMGGCAIKSKGLLSSIIMHIFVNIIFVFYGII